MDTTTLDISPEEPTGERWDPLGAPNDEETVLDLDKLSFDCDHHQ